MQYIYFVVIITVMCACGGLTDDKHKQAAMGEVEKEQYRPQYHFTPDSMWMNDPNGMVYYEGEYHLFYQYYPDSTIWGPMHWGHAISTDLVHWDHQLIALYPDSLGWVFSGSAVVDWKNTSGFGTEENPPMVAVFTQHDHELEKTGSIKFQTQGIAYSLDKGRTWEMYNANPVVANPDIKDFRDPKVIWSEKYNKWIMALAVKDHVGFYSSPDLKTWKHESDFGKDAGGHGGVWECPDLFPIKDDKGTEKWVLLVSINPGGPNGGSATQYFVGEFDGTHFINENPSKEPIWLDYGKDNYAGVTWSDIPKEDGRRIFIGWMSNWQYATVVPTERWRSSMTLPRELKLHVNNGAYQLYGKPVHELSSVLNKNATGIDGIQLRDETSEIFKGKVDGDAWCASLKIGISETKTFSVKMKNDLKEEATLVFNVDSNRVEFDRTKSGRIDFHPEFAVPIVGIYLFDKAKELEVEFYWDASGIELFINNGQFQMTNLVFPKQSWSLMEVTSEGETQIIDGSIVAIK